MEAVKTTADSSFRPRLRPGLAASRSSDDGNSIVIFDELRLSQSTVSLLPIEFSWLQFFDGRQTLREIQSTLMKNEDGSPISIEQLCGLIEKLESAYFLDGERFQSLLTSPIREPSCIGCYPENPDELRKHLSGFFTGPNGPGTPEPRKSGAPLRALLVPHIDYPRGGISYAFGYKELAERTDASIFVVIGTSHYSAARFTLTRKNFKTPLGTVPTDQTFVDRLVAAYGDDLFEDELAHIPEHSIELEVVFLQYLFENIRPIRIVPLLAGSLHDRIEAGSSPRVANDISKMIAAIQSAEAASSEPICFVISGDLAHIGQQFGDPGRLTTEILSASREADLSLMECASRCDMEAYFQQIAGEGDCRRICGLPPTYTAIHAARPSFGRLLHYGQFVNPGKTSSVSFASMAFYQ